MEITAVFESADMAECAMVRMRELGVDLRLHKMRAAGARGFSQNPGKNAGYGIAAPPPGANFYGMLDMWAPSVFMRRDYAAADEGQYEPGGEVTVRLTVPDSQAKRAGSALTGCHGRRVRVIGN